MDKSNAIEIIKSISMECDENYKCKHCAFYNTVKNIEGCIFDKLVLETSPEYFIDVLERNK
ncbi:hypothetical protein [Clostridium sporogenes]|uniref:hypothetical protein n=1 Tax=Clostridium sporogenes TaxID=1509 RepID=UPI00024BAC96|nr:hypothetical protein [Clostridium sporogenes]EHN15509.1 hypothetical protein IYC_08548 [Clostridium sporogenes PA 3679]MDU4597727.1 hypothetical protein [Clostridium sporogenes]NFQ34618.1 hypothetical protein [Clostridium sporogenes]NFQ59025.1 hypothetical protein [Clostridium sporogenes]NFU09260.1 hypothetical protein [Clostridium sporogenes]